MDDEILGIALGDWDGISLGRVRIQQAWTGRIKELLTQKKKSMTAYLLKV